MPMTDPTGQAFCESCRNIVRRRIKYNEVDRSDATNFLFLCAVNGDLGFERKIYCRLLASIYHGALLSSSLGWSTEFQGYDRARQTTCKSDFDHV
jgi:hypothetical protein